MLFCDFPYSGHFLSSSVNIVTGYGGYRRPGFYHQQSRHFVFVSAFKGPGVPDANKFVRRGAFPQRPITLGVSNDWILTSMQSVASCT
jgi:hypothetical protein